MGRNPGRRERLRESGLGSCRQEKNPLTTARGHDGPHSRSSARDPFSGTRVTRAWVKRNERRPGAHRLRTVHGRGMVGPWFGVGTRLAGGRDGSAYGLVNGPLTQTWV